MISIKLCCFSSAGIWIRKVVVRIQFSLRVCAQEAKSVETVAYRVAVTANLIWIRFLKGNRSENTEAMSTRCEAKYRAGGHVIVTKHLFVTVTMRKAR